MNRWNVGNDDRARELAAAKALGVFDAAELTEIGELERDPAFAGLVAEFERTAAAVDVGSWSAEHEMPAALKQRVSSAAAAWSSDRATGNGAAPKLRISPENAPGERSAAPADRERGRAGWRAGVAWVAAAAAIALAVIGWWPRLTGNGGGGTRRLANAEAARAELTSHCADMQRLTWSKGPDASASANEGEVFWSPSLQRGYMVFRGLRVNDPTREQYQLWVFDSERDDRYPVDGALFDVPIGVAELVVPIAPKLNVSNAAAFVVTVERPGGVWVSDRSRIATIAKKS